MKECSLLYYTNITLTPKPFKDKMRKKSFRPILLLTQMHKFKICQGYLF